MSMDNRITEGDLHALMAMGWELELKKGDGFDGLLTMEKGNRIAQANGGEAVRAFIKQERARYQLDEWMRAHALSAGIPPWMDAVFRAGIRGARLRLRQMRSRGAISGEQLGEALLKLDSRRKYR